MSTPHRPRAFPPARANEFEFAFAFALPLALACNPPPADATTTTDTSSSTTSPSTTTASTDDTDPPTSTTDPTTTSSSDTDAPLEACPTVLPPTIHAELPDLRIDESSGLAHSRAHPGVFWIHNDSGDSARFFAVDDLGHTLAAYHLDGVDPVDWEDMALGPGPDDGPWIYLGDIGDNLEDRKQIAVHRLPEPDPRASGGGDLVLAGAEVIRFSYPDGPHDAETLLVDPQSGDLAIVTKGDKTRIYRAAAPLTPAGLHVLEEVQPVVAPLIFASGGDVSPAGDFVAIRSHDQALLWLRPAGGELGDAFAAAPCVLPLAVEVQGEALAIARDGRGYFTLGELATPPLWRYVFE